MHGTSPYTLGQLDNPKRGTSRNGDKYLLLSRDDHSHYVWLLLLLKTNADNAAQEVNDWCATSGVIVVFMSNGSTHFGDEDLHLVTKSLRKLFQFTPT